MGTKWNLINNTLENIVGADLDSKDDGHYTGDWLNISSFGLIHHQSYFRHNGQVHSIDYSRYRPDRLPDNYGGIEFQEINDLYFMFGNKVNLSPHAKTSKYVRYAKRQSNEGIYSFGVGEGWWQAAGAIELANEGYIILDESLTSHWAPGRPDLACFKLGELQQVLADIGIVPGGATLPEIELRSKYNRLEPEQITVEKTTGIVEVKDSNKATRGIKELRDHRSGGDRKPAYLDSDEIEEGWLVCPDERSRIRQTETIGGITWDSDAITTIEPTKTEAPDRGSALREAKAITLRATLRHQPLNISLSEAVSRCLNDPQTLYSII